MTEAYLCDAIAHTRRTLRGCSLLRTPRRSSPAHVIRSTLLEAQSRAGPGDGHRRRASWAAPIRPARTTATSPACRCCWRDVPDSVPGVNVQSPLRLRAWRPSAAPRAPPARARRMLMLAGGVESHVAGPPSSWRRRTAAFSRRRRGLRHDHRLALREQEAEGALRDRTPCPTPPRIVARERISRSPREDQDRLRATVEPGEGGRGAGGCGRLAEEIAAVTIPQRKKDPIVVDRDEHPRQTSLEKLAALPAPFRRRRDGDGRQCLGRERRGVRRHHCLGRGGREIRADAQGADHGDADGGRRAPDHGDRAGAGFCQADGAAGASDRRYRRDRAERGLCRPGPGRHAPAGPGRTMPST